MAFNSPAEAQAAYDADMDVLARELARDEYLAAGDGDGEDEDVATEYNPTHQLLDMVTGGAWRKSGS